MISIQTYLRTPGNFLREDDWHRPSDTEHVEGAIVMLVNGTEIMGLDEWDDINWLWPYMINMLEELEGAPEASTYFPDQPILLKLIRRSSEKLSVELSYQSVERIAHADFHEFLAAFEEAGDRFFKRMGEIIPEESAGFNSERARLEAVVTRLSVAR